MIRRDEHGMALYAAIVIGVLVLGLVAVLSSLVLGQVDENRRSAQRTEAAYWVQAAGSKLSNELSTMQIGRQNYVGLDPTGAFELWRPPTTVARGWDAGKSAFKVALSSGASGGTVRYGHYRLMPPVPGAPAGTIAFAVNGSMIDTRGTVLATVRGWTDADKARANDVSLVLRRGSVSRFSMLSDMSLDLGTIGASSLRGAVHSNNSNGAANGVTVSGSALASVDSVTTRAGAISGPCPAGRCRADTDVRIPFAAADRSFNLVQQLGSNCAGGVLCWFKTPTSTPPAQTVPAWRIDISGAGCAAITRIAMPLRRDAGSVPSVNDTSAPTNLGSGGTFCPAVGGGAILFDTDVEIRGVRAANARPITVLARRASPPTVNINGVSSRVSTPASVFLVGNVGTANANAPIGIVAEGSAYIPSWAHGAGLETRKQIRNVALMTKHGQLSMGPATLAIAGAADSVLAGGTNIEAGGGLSACAARDAGYGASPNITITGSIASRRQPSLQYGTAACWVGHRNRDYSWLPRIGWDPPPAYPMDQPWHMAKWEESAS